MDPTYEVGWFVDGTLRFFVQCPTTFLWHWVQRWFCYVWSLMGDTYIKDLYVFLPSSKIWSSTILLNIWYDTRPSDTKCSLPHFRYLVYTSSMSSVEQWWLIHNWQWLILRWSPKETEVLQFAEVTWHNFLLNLLQVLSL